MDETMFDDVTRTAGSSRTRRWLALQLAGAALVALAGSARVVPDEVDAGRRRRKRRRRGNGRGGDNCNQTLCDGRCVDLANDPNNCGACGRTCAAGLACCDGVCRALRTDNSNCGACGNACFISGSRFCACGICVFCPLGAVLSQDTCRCDCPDGQTNCGGVCRATC